MRMPKMTRKACLIFRQIGKYAGIAKGEYQKYQNNLVLAGS
jgi:hypothetical protein